LLGKDRILDCVHGCISCYSVRTRSSPSEATFIRRSTQVLNAARFVARINLSRVRTIASEDCVAAGGIAGVDEIVVVAAVEEVETEPAKELIVAGATEQRIASGQADQRVVAGPPRAGRRRRMRR
jgi:hypothetical protein